MRNPRVEHWEEKLDTLLRRVDERLELEYGGIVPRHPARPAHGETGNPQNDGLFRITATFTPGFNSRLGKGYVVTIEPVTLADFPQDAWRKIERKACRLINAGLESVLPGRNLRLHRDGNVWKITGDLSLDKIETKN
ncbi:MAG: hypothetical protein FWG50_08365 [Kiritimatiellaeota bacterium]|nr:hypothetical protein [Kiritimatiellota bacterium]